MTKPTPGEAPTLEQRTRAAIYRVSGNDQTKETDTLESIGLDSLDRAALLVDLETEFSTVIPTFADDDWKTVADVIATVREAVRP